MPGPPAPELTLLKAFEGAMREGLLLDEALGGMLDAALRFFDAAAVALLPAGAPPMTRSGRSLIASAAEQRLSEHLAEILTQGRPNKMTESGLAFFGAPVKVAEQVRAAFGLALGAGSANADAEDAVRLFARSIAHVLERERTLATLMKRREEAVALFEFASGALHSLNADEVIRLTVASLSRELEFDRVLAYRFHPGTREVEEIVTHGSGEETNPGAPPGRRPIEQVEILARCLAAHGPVFDDEEQSGGGPTRRRRLALPIQAGENIFGFLKMSRRGGFVLTPQEMRLAQELAKLAAGALEKARLIASERVNAERVAFVGRLHTSLSGLNELPQVLQRTVEEVGTHFDLDLCAVRFVAGDLPATSASFVKAGLRAPSTGDEVPDALLAHLSALGSHILFPDATTAPNGLALVPAPALVKNLPRPISLVAVPLAYRGSVVGVLAALAGGRPRGLGSAILHSFEAIAVELSLAVTSTGLLQKERDSYRFLDRLREVGQSLTTTFDAPRIKQILCEQGVTLLKADAAQFWDADPMSKSLQITTRWGADVGGEVGRLIPTEKSNHPVVRCFTDKTLVIAGEADAKELFPVSPGSAGSPLSRAVVVPLVFQNELCGLLSVVGRRSSEPWSSDLPSRLSLLADQGAVALHNARLMKIIEQQTERDAQTGLYNRASILKRLEAEVRRAERGNRSVAVAHIRLDGLAEAVQKFGPSFGDSLLPKAASQLVHATRAVNVVGRDKFDRFWILILDATKAQAVRAVESLQKTFNPVFDPRLEQANMKFSLSVGLAAYPEDAFDTPSLVLRAEEALDDAVRSGPGTVVQYGALADADSGPPM